MIFVCSPYRGNIEQNTLDAQQYCKEVIKAGEIPIAPHLYFPQFLDDTSPVERSMGIKAGLELMTYCREVWVFGETVTEGMQEEISFARTNNIPVKQM